MTRSAGRPSAFHSRTALISLIAGSPRLTIAMRLNAARESPLVTLPTETLIGYPPKAARMSSLVLPALCAAACWLTASWTSSTTSSATMAGSMRITA
jgi:hypothetical protein